MKELPIDDVSFLANMAITAISDEPKSTKELALQSYQRFLKNEDSRKIGEYLMDPKLKKKKARNSHSRTALAILDWAESNLTEYENRWVTGTFKQSRLKGIKL